MLRPASRRASRPSASPSEPRTPPYDPETAQLPYGPNPYQQAPYQQAPDQQARSSRPVRAGPVRAGSRRSWPPRARPSAGAAGARDPAAPRARKHRVRRLLRRRSVRIILALVAVFCCWLAFSIGQALAAPNGGSTSSKLAEWARDHYLGPVVTFGEWLSYDPPKAGGKPSFSLAVPKAGSVKYKHTKTFQPIIPKRLSSPAGTPLAGEGQWRVLETVKGEPGHLRHLPAAVVGVYLIRGRDRLDGPAIGHLPAAPWRPGPGPRQLEIPGLDPARQPHRPAGHVQRRVRAGLRGRRLLSQRHHQGHPDQRAPRRSSTTATARSRSAAGARRCG